MMWVAVVNLRNLFCMIISLSLELFLLLLLELELF